MWHVEDSPLCSSIGMVSVPGTFKPESTLRAAGLHWCPRPCPHNNLQSKNTIEGERLKLNGTTLEGIKSPQACAGFVLAIACMHVRFLHLCTCLLKSRWAHLQINVPIHVELRSDGEDASSSGYSAGGLGGGSLVQSIPRFPGGNTLTHELRARRLHELCTHVCLSSVLMLDAHDCMGLVLMIA